MIKQYNVTVNGTTYEVTVESAAGGSRMASMPVAAEIIRLRSWKWLSGDIWFSCPHTV